MRIRITSKSTLLSCGSKKHAAVQGICGISMQLFCMLILIPFQDLSMKELPTDTYYKFGISLFFLATKQKGKIQGNGDFICWLHWLYDFT